MLKTASHLTPTTGATDMTESGLIERLRMRVIPDPLLDLMQLDPLCQQAALTIERLRLRTHPPEYARLIEAADYACEIGVITSELVDALATTLAAIKGNPYDQG